MRRSVYIMLFILLCFSGTLMDVIIIRIFILFKIWETRSVWTDVLSTALRDSSNSRKSENVRSVSSKNFAELKLYLVRNSDVECTLISCVFPNADLMCHQLKGSSDNEKREFQRRVPSSKLKMDMCFSFLTLDTSHKQPVCLFSSHFNILASQSIFFFQFLPAHRHFWDRLTAEGSNLQCGQVRRWTIRKGLSLLTDREYLKWWE